MKCKVVMLGSASAGKTSIINRQVYSTFNDNVKPTLGAGLSATTISVESNPLLPKKSGMQGLPTSDPNGIKKSNSNLQGGDDKIDVTLNLWDTAGQESYRSLARVYYRDSQAAIIVFDVTNRNSFKEADFWLNELQSCSLHDKCLIFIVGNKIDLVNQAEITNDDNNEATTCEPPQLCEREVTIEEAQALARQNKGFYFETSAKDGRGVNKLFESVAERFVVSHKSSIKQSLPSPSFVSQSKRRMNDDSDDDYPNSNIINIVDNDDYAQQGNNKNSDCCS